MTAKRNARMPVPEAGPKRWWERWWEPIATAVIAGLIIWAVTRHYEKPAAIEESRTQPQPQADQRVSSPSQAMAEQKPTQPKPQTSQHTKTKVIGNDNVAGNNVTGSGNVVGNNNQVSTPTVSAPNGIAIGGGNVTNPTVNNNFAPAPRSLTPDQHRTLANLLRASGTFTVVLRHAEHNYEAQQYCDQFKAVFQEAGWNVIDEFNARLIPEARPGQGLQIMVNGPSNVPVAAQAVFKSLKQVGIDATGSAMPAFKPTDFEFYVGVQ